MACMRSFQCLASSLLDTNTKAWEGSIQLSQYGESKMVYAARVNGEVPMGGVAHTPARKGDVVETAVVQIEIRLGPDARVRSQRRV